MLKLIIIYFPIFLVYQSPGAMIPVPCSNGSATIGNNLPSLFLEDFITPGSGPGNLVPYCGPNLTGYPSEDSTVTSWYLNLPPPPAPPAPPSSISLLSNQAPNIDTFVAYPQNTSAIITLPTNSSLDPSICTIKPPDELLSKIGSHGLNEIGLTSSLSSKNGKVLE